MTISDSLNIKPKPAYIVAETDDSEYYSSENEINFENEYKNNQNVNNYKNKYYDILFILPKEKRKKILCKDIEEQFKKRKNERKLEKNKFLASINIMKKINKHKYFKEIKNIKEKHKEFVHKFDCLEKEFTYFYNNNLTICKEKKCKNKCANDIGYCIDHYPDICDKCNHICDKNNKFDKLNNNKYYQIYNLCNECVVKRHKEIFKEKLPEEKLFHKITDDDKYNELFSTLNFEKLLLNTNIYKKLIKLQEDDGISISDLRNKLTEPKYLEHINIKKEDINFYTKYELWRQFDKSYDLINTFNDKIKYIKISDFRLRKWGTFQFKAFKEHLYEIFYGEDYINNENYFNDMFLDLDEPNTAYPIVDLEKDKDNVCNNCGTNGILPNNNYCVSCKFSGIV